MHSHDNAILLQITLRALDIKFKYDLLKVHVDGRKVGRVLKVDHLTLEPVYIAL